ncbi:MAG: sulfatase-like hydrolase/transferase [Verrucomicrobiaceae bacterium]|nr:sulfatase-like hydrolase/transferase [Verrucomicrobiaceae bacterium]
MSLPVAQCLALDEAKPNIIVIVADDLGYADVFFNPLHSKQIKTPHLDSLASQSVVCRQGYVTGHVCSVTRAGLMTGRYQQRLGLYTGGEAGSGLPMTEKIFPQFLKPAGYATCQLGKWHLGPDLQWSPALRGFDEVFGFLGRGAHDYFKLDDPEDPIYRGTEVVKETGYLTDRLGEEAVAFIGRQKSHPFFLYLAFNAVHAPLQAPEDEIAKFDTGNPDRNTLLAMGKRMDDAIGSIVAKLKSDGTWENTLLFFISDNGGPLAQTADNTPLRGGKHQDYEGGIRVPFLVCWPSKLKAGSSDVVVSSLDILPTVLAATGIDLPADKPLDGINLFPILTGETVAPKRELFWCSGSDEGWWAVRSGDWKVVGEKGTIGLFDLANDVSEANNLAPQMREKVAALTQLHTDWLATMAEPVKAGAKRFDLAPGGQPEGKRPKKKKKNQGVAATDGSITESFAAMPGKPWKTQRGTWEIKEAALWGSASEGERDAMMRCPATFAGGTLALDFNLSLKSRFALRFASTTGEALFRADITEKALTVTKLGDRNELLKKLPLEITADAWHKLTLKFDGPELYAELDGSPLPISDAVFANEKSEATFLLSGRSVGFRHFSLQPASSKP